MRTRTYELLYPFNGIYSIFLLKADNSLRHVNPTLLKGTISISQCRC